MDEQKPTPVSQEVREAPVRPTVDKQDCTPQTLFTPHAAYNDFLLRLEQLRSYHKDWNDPRNQNRPFKQSFVDFIKQLVLRLPVAPEITPLVNGTIRFRYKKSHAPRDKWQIMEIVIYPQRHFEMVAQSRMPNQEPFKRTNMARPDYLSDMIQAFYELDHVNTKEHPLRYRKATVVDYPYIAAMCQTTFGPHGIYHTNKISKLLKYCVVADDPMYGIVSVVSLSESDAEDADYEVSIMMTAQNYRGLSIASKCLRKALTNLLLEHPNARVIAKSVMADGNLKDVAQSPLRRAGFKRVKVVRGEKRYKCFDCDRCNTLNGYCDFQNPASVCSTAYYVLGDYGGKMGYGGNKATT